MRFRPFLTSLMISLPLVLSGCSLLEVKLDSQTTPLTQQELNMRVMTREYAHQFFSEVEKNADQIATQYEAQDKLHQSYVLLWKINAEEGLQRSAYQLSPMAALIDSWVFTQQMDNFFQSGNGQSLFNSDLAKQTAAGLTRDIEQLAQSLLKKESYQSTQTFIKSFVAAHPFTDLTFTRTPAYRAWLQANQIDEAQAVSTLGTMPEAMSDVSDRLSLVSEQTPKIMTWKAQLIAMNSSLSGEQLTETLRSIQASSASFQDFVVNNPEYMRNLAEYMAVELQPLVEDIDQKTQQHLDKLSDERAALEAMVARERAEIAAIIHTERAQFATDIDQISQNVLALAMDKVTQLIKSTILYFVLFIVVIFFAPLGLGYWLGKRSAGKQIS
ncbi:MAG: chemotaxis protein [Vibrio sp.]